MMVVAESDGIWGQATGIPVPGDANAALIAVTCTSVGNCVAVGNGAYADGPADQYTYQQAILVTETNGVWGQPTAPVLPAGYNPIDAVAALNSVACSSAGNCVAVGDDTDTSGNIDAMLVTESGGSWSVAQQVVLPSNHDTSGSYEDSQLNSIQCADASDCVAVGDYTDESHIGQAMTVTLAGGPWAAATEVPAPSGATSSELGAVSCTSVGNCVAGGGYSTVATGALDEPMVANESRGIWGPETELAAPGAGAPQSAYLNGVSCTSAGNCAAGGISNSDAIVVDESAGTWEQGAALDVPGQPSTVNALSCASAQSCVAVGSYMTISGSQAMVDTSVMPLGITTSNLPSGTVGLPYSAQLTAAGGTGTDRWSITTGQLPQGLSLHATTGVVSGTPTRAGTSRITVGATDKTNPAQHALATFTIAVSSAPRGKPTLGRSTFRGGKLTTRLACKGSRAAICAGTLALTTQDHKGHTSQTLTLGRTGYRVNAGKSASVTIKVNAAGRRLLAEQRKLPAKLAATPLKDKHAVATRSLTL